jgi:hypothetical protein
MFGLAYVASAFDRGEQKLSHQYQIDYGNGYEDVPPGDVAGTAGPAAAAAGRAEVEREGDARRARVLSDGRVVEERDFGCVVVESRTRPGGSTRHVVHCAGGDILVEEQPDGTLSGASRPGYVGNADRALERAYEAVRTLKS